MTVRGKLFKVQVIRLLPRLRGERERGGRGVQQFKQSVLEGAKGGSVPRWPPSIHPSAVLCCHLGRAAGRAGGPAPRPRSSRGAPAAALLLRETSLCQRCSRPLLKAPAVTKWTRIYVMSKGSVFGEFGGGGGCECSWG